MAKKEPKEAPAEKAPDKAEAQEAAQPSSRKGGAKQILLSLVLLIALVAGAAGAAVLATMFIIEPSKPEPTEPEPQEVEEGREYEFKLEEALIVNVYQTQQRRYLSVKPVFVMESNGGLEQLKAKQGELLHVLIGILKGKTLDQLDDPQVTNTLSREIVETVNIKLELESPIARVRFMQFVVQ